jgi:HK97 family phage major capsid protein
MTNANLIAQLEANAAQFRVDANKLRAEARKHNRALEPDEMRTHEDLSEKITEITARLAELRAEDVVADQAAGVIRQYGLGSGDGVVNTKRAVGGAYAKGQDVVYTKDSGFSYFADLASSAMPGSSGFYGALNRLQAHAQMIDRAQADLPREFRAGPNKRAANENRATPSRVDGNGGYFVPPLWQIDKYVPYLRAGRTTANLFDNQDLPGGTDVISIPKVKTGTLVGYQADNGAVTSQDITDDVVTGPVRTFAGQEDVPVQLLEQSPINFDELLWKDLTSSYNQQVDVGCLYGTGTGLQIKGLTQIAGLNAITFTSGAPTAQLLLPILAQAASQIARQRFAPPTAFVWHPAVWYWFTSQLDTTGRPLVNASDTGGMNSIAVYDEAASEGLAGRVGSVPIYVDANVQTTIGGNQCGIYAAKFDDLTLYEGAVRTNAYQQVLSGTLQVRIQLYNFVATIVDRYPTTVSTVNGTGLVFPAGF